MGEETQFESGDQAPNDGVYIEIGEDDYHMGINDPKQMELKKGQRLPKTSNDDRKWKLKRH